MYSRIISSSNITRKGLRPKEMIRNLGHNSEEDDDQFFENLLIKIRKDFSPNKENHIAAYQNKKLQGAKKRKGTFDPQTEDLIKRFKKSIKDNEEKYNCLRHQLSNENCNIEYLPKRSKETQVNPNLYNNKDSDFNFRDVSQEKSNAKVAAIFDAEVEGLIYCENKEWP